MASYTAINLSSVIADIKAALNAKGLIGTLHYESDSNLIFSTGICSKVIRINWYSARQLDLYYGDAWKSGTTITNSVTFSTQAYSAANTGMHCVADTTFFFLLAESSSYLTCAYVGALSNGDELVFGLIANSSSSYYNNNLCKNLTDAVDLAPITFNRGFSDSNNLMSQPLMWCNSSSRQIEKDGANAAGTVGVKNVSFEAAAGQVIVGTTGLITPGLLYSQTAGGVATRTSLLVEFS
ncbi:MAG TPA: hypothetical protein PKO32_03230 [Syntrophomonadaceae bacterium]|nr:hypothetical protein [Syntrophomonadaceae bacterium]